MPTYDDYVREGLFDRFEDRMDTSRATNSEEIIRRFEYFQNRKASEKQTRLLIKYSRKRGLKVRSAYERIHKKIRQGKSANQIQKELKQEGVGIRRQRLLYMIRTVKGTKSKRLAQIHKK